MAINYVISYTFSPSTTISSSQVNTNTSDNANTWNGLEALTKSFAKLKIDVDPSTALEVATKQYVDHYSSYRRPNLVYSSATVVNMETGTGTISGAATILFPDGNLRSDSSSGRINGNIAQNAVLSGTAQSGLRTGSAAANTWYYCYAVKVSDNANNFVMVIDTVLPLVANYATLNANFGTGNWVYLGTIAYGDGASATTSIAKFTQSGNRTAFVNAAVGTVVTPPGIIISKTAGATSLDFSYSAGSAIGSNQIPNHFTLGDWTIDAVNTTSLSVTDQANAVNIWQINGISASTATVRISSWPFASGFHVVPSASRAIEIAVSGFVDGVLGVGSNPIL